jgi:hypothetical protein
MTPHDGPWTPRNPARGRAVAIVGLILIALVLVSGARTAFNGGSTGDFPIYFRAAVATAHGESLKSAAEQGYLAPPLCSLVMAPLALLSQAAAAVVWTIATFALFGVMIWFGSRDAVARWKLPSDPVFALGVALAAALLSLLQLRHEIRGGQVDGLLVAGFFFGLYFLDRRPWIAGLAIGFGINIKFTAIILIPYLILRRRFAAAASGLFFTVAFALLPALISGWRTNLENLSLSLGGILKLVGIDIGDQATSNIPALDYYRSVSITSVVSRMTLDRLGHTGMYAAIGAIALAAFGACWCIYGRTRTPLWARPRLETADAPAVTSLEWCALIVAVLLFSPQTQVRHMVILIIPHITAVVIILRRPRASSWLIAGLVIEQAGLHLPPADWTSEATVDAVRAVGWTSWCLLAFLLTLLWTGLSRCRDLRSAPCSLSTAGV